MTTESTQHDYTAAGEPSPPNQPPAGSPKRAALIALGVLCLAAVVVGVLAIAGVFSNSKSTAKREGPGRQVAANGHAGGGRTGAAAAAHVNSLDASSGTTSCGGDLFVGPNTSCDFAYNVEQAYDTSSGGATYVYAYSPSTGQNYQLYCTADLPHVCTGGNNASVYFTSGPGGSIPSDTTNCGSNVYAGPSTSCDFASNVQQAYASSGAWGDHTVFAYSPATGQTFEMYCTAGPPHLCTGGNNASVYFP